MRRYIPIILKTSGLALSLALAAGCPPRGAIPPPAAPEAAPRIPPPAAPPEAGEAVPRIPPRPAAPAAPSAPAADVVSIPPPAAPAAPSAPAAPRIPPPAADTAPTAPVERVPQEIRDAAQGLANKTLETSNIAYNAPETIQLDDTAVVQLVLSPSFSIDELKKRITEPGKKEGASIPFPPFSRRVEAHLTGSAFKIAALGSEIPRAIEPGRVCEWSWEVTPTQPGTQRLFLTIDAVVAIDGRDAASYERVFVRTIKVKVTLGQRVASFVGNNWQWLWTVGLVPLGGWLFARVRRKRLGQSDA